MKTEQLAQERESWRMVVAWQKNGEPDQSPSRDDEMHGGLASHQAAWQRLIDHQLIEWQRNPEQLNEPETVTPSKETIGRAIYLARVLSREPLAAPTRIVPDAHGGIVFERKDNSLFESLRISADGGVEHCVFEDCRLVRRERWPVQFGENL